MAGYWPKHTKKELGQYPAILTSYLVNNPYLFFQKLLVLENILFLLRISSAFLSCGKLFLKGAINTAMLQNFLNIWWNNDSMFTRQCSEIINMKILGELLGGGKIVTSSWVVARYNDFVKVCQRLKFETPYAGLLCNPLHCNSFIIFA